MGRQEDKGTRGQGEDFNLHSEIELIGILPGSKAAKLVSRCTFKFGDRGIYIHIPSYLKQNLFIPVAPTLDLQHFKLVSLMHDTKPDVKIFWRNIG